MLTFDIQSGDTVIGNRGQLKEVTGTPALKLIIKDFLCTKTGLDTIIGSVKVPEQIETYVYSSVLTAFDELLVFQKDEYADQRSSIEKLSEIKTFIVTQVPNSTSWTFYLETLSEDFVVSTISGFLQYGR